MGPGPDIADRPLILLVENQPRLLRLLQRTLEKEGYQVLPAIDGSDALEKMADANSPVDLLIADLCLPKLGGVALKRHLDTAGTRVPTMFTTGWPHLVQESLRDGVPVLQKPFTPREFLVQVTASLDSER